MIRHTTRHERQQHPIYDQNTGEIVAFASSYYEARVYCEKWNQPTPQPVKASEPKTPAKPTKNEGGAH